MQRYLITGASRGIGRAIALHLAGPDRELYLQGRDKDALHDVAETARRRDAEVIEIIADLATPEGVTLPVEKTGGEKLDALINNAGVTYVAPFEEITLDQWQQTLAINVTAPFLLTQNLLPQLEKGSSIVNILSVAAYTTFPHWSSYSMSKFALDGMSRCLREELRPRGIRVINIYPAATNTDLWENVPGDWARENMLDPDEVARAAAYALSRPPSVLVEDIKVGSNAGNQ